MGNILKISEAASLALHAMAIMAQDTEKLVSAKEIAQVLQVSHNHLSKVLQRLVKAELIVSIKGYGGGFKLAKSPEEITFLDVYEVIEGRFKPSNCLLDRSKTCEDCIMGDLLFSINKQVEEFFGGTKLSDFAK